MEMRERSQKFSICLQAALHRDQGFKQKVAKEENLHLQSSLQSILLRLTSHHELSSTLPHLKRDSHITAGTEGGILFWSEDVSNL